MYSQPITQHAPSAVIFCLDCSTSMQEMVKFNNLWMSKSEIVSMITNIMIDELYIRSSRHNRMRHYYDIAVIGYHDNRVDNLLTGGDIELTSITELDKYEPCCREYSFKQYLSDGKSLYANFVTRDWIVASADGKTPMYEALIEAYRLVDEWCSMHKHHNSFPPMVFHITDGNATDGRPIDLISIANSIKETGTQDGHTLLINVHIGSGEEYCERGALFPNSLDIHTASEQMATLFAMSSEAPQSLLHQLPCECVQEGAPLPRLVAYNISPCEIFNIVNIGSESAKD